MSNDKDTNALNTAELIQTSLINSLKQKAKESHRGRINHNFHDLSEVYQRFLNVLTLNTYIQPHRHIHPPKPETFISLQGDLGVVLFDETGLIIEKHRISSIGPIFGIDIKAKVYHSIVCLSEFCVCFEGKSGPYDPTLDKDFAIWAPNETDQKSKEYLVYLKNLF